MFGVDRRGRLARYMVEARERSLPPDVAREARHRILDSLAAMVSGAHLKPGEMAIKYARAQGGVAEATVVTTDIRTTAVSRSHDGAGRMGFGRRARREAVGAGVDARRKPPVRRPAVKSCRGGT